MANSGKGQTQIGQLNSTAPGWAHDVATASSKVYYEAQNIIAASNLLLMLWQIDF